MAGMLAFGILPKKPMTAPPHGGHVEKLENSVWLTSLNNLQ